MNELLDLSKQDEQLLNMRKDIVRTLCLTKFPLNDVKSRVGLVLDCSGSEYDAFRNGTLQGIIDRILPLAINFDVDGLMDMWTFSNSFTRLPSITRDNHRGYVKRNIDTPKGGTNYAPVMLDIFKKYILEEPHPYPNYIIFITDGDNSDSKQTERAIKTLAHFPIFFQFVGVGDGSCNYLEHLDEMEGRFVDNANFFKIKNLADAKAISDNDIYSLLLKEYPVWLKYKQVKKMLSSPHFNPQKKYSFLMNRYNPYRDSTCWDKILQLFYR